MANGRTRRLFWFWPPHLRRPQPRERVRDIASAGAGQAAAAAVEEREYLHRRIHIDVCHASEIQTEPFQRSNEQRSERGDHK